MSRFFCDCCSLEKINDKGDLYKKYYSCYQIGDWKKHIKSKQHRTNLKKMREVGTFTCNYCNEKFDKDGYTNHINNNSLFHKIWNIYDNKEFSCNNFIINQRRATDYENWKKIAFSREKNSNGYKPKSLRQNTKNHMSALYGKKYVEKKLNSSSSCSSIEEDSSSEEEYQPIDYCSDIECGLPIYDNLTIQKKDILRFRKQLFCECKYCSDYSSSEESQEAVEEDLNKNICMKIT